jgi:hypothetical protein
LEQYHNLIEKYHTVRTVPKSNRKTKNTTLLEQYQNLIEKQNIPHCWNRNCLIVLKQCTLYTEHNILVGLFSCTGAKVLLDKYNEKQNKKYHIVGKVPKYNRKT